MVLHLIKLSVGSENYEHMAAWQKQRLKDLKAAGKKPELIHVTRQTPKRAEDILSGGSIYWVVKGGIVARQKILELRPMTREGIVCCGIVYDSELIPVKFQPRRAFQGWRYLNVEDAPADRLLGDNDDEMPEEMRRELELLGLL